MGISRPLIDIAIEQGGYITREQLVDQGFSLSAIDRMLAMGQMTKVADSVYQLIPPHEVFDEVRGAVLALPDPTISHHAAAHLLDLPVQPEFVPTVTVASRTTHDFPGVVVRRCDDLIPDHITTVRSLKVTNVIRTAFDLAGILRFREFDSIAEAAIIAGRMTLDEFSSITAELARKGKPGSRAAKTFIAMRTGQAPGSSTLERLGRSILTRSGLPHPTPEYPIPWARRKRFDDAYPEASLALEWDSRAWHEQRRAMQSDRRRDRLAALHGWTILRFTWDDVTEHPDEIVATVRELLDVRSALSLGR